MKLEKAYPKKSQTPTLKLLSQVYFCLFSGFYVDVDNLLLHFDLSLLIQD